MTRQLDLPGHAGLELEPEAGRSEPRPWVRRFVIRSEPGVMLREVHLRPGLNIVRAPDPADRAAVSDGDDTVGHGSCGEEVPGHLSALALVEACRHWARFRLAVVGRSATLWAVRAIVHAA